MVVSAEVSAVIVSAVPVATSTLICLCAVLAIFDELERTMSTTHGLAKKAQLVMTECRRQNIKYAESHPGSPSLIFRQNILNTHARQYQRSVEQFQQSSEEFKRALTQKITRQARIGLFRVTARLLRHLSSTFSEFKMGTNIEGE
jgi:hypothetical protein